MANELISILNNQIEGIKQDKIKAEQLAIEKENPLLCNCITMWTK